MRAARGYPGYDPIALGDLVSNLESKVGEGISQAF